VGGTAEEHLRIGALEFVCFCFFSGMGSFSGGGMGPTSIQTIQKMASTFWDSPPVYLFPACISPCPWYPAVSLYVSLDVPYDVRPLGRKIREPGNLRSKVLSYISLTSPKKRGAISENRRNKDDHANHSCLSVIPFLFRSRRLFGGRNGS